MKARRGLRRTGEGAEGESMGCGGSGGGRDVTFQNSGMPSGLLPPASHAAFLSPLRPLSLSRFIVSLGFSGGDGQRLVVVTGDNRHTVFVYHWRSKTLIYNSSGHNGQPPQVRGGGGVHRGVGCV